MAPKIVLLVFSSLLSLDENIKMSFLLLGNCESMENSCTSAFALTHAVFMSTWLIGCNGCSTECNNPWLLPDPFHSLSVVCGQMDANIQITCLGFLVHNLSDNIISPLKLYKNKISYQSWYESEITKMMYP